MTITAQELHDAVDLAMDLVGDCLYDLPHQAAGGVDRLAAWILAHMVAVHVGETSNPADFLERLRACQHELVAKDDE